MCQANPTAGETEKTSRKRSAQFRQSTCRPVAMKTRGSQDAPSFLCLLLYEDTPMLAGTLLVPSGLEADRDTTWPWWPASLALDPHTPRARDEDEDEELEDDEDDEDDDDLDDDFDDDLDD